MPFHFDAHHHPTSHDHPHHDAAAAHGIHHHDAAMPVTSLHPIPVQPHTIFQVQAGCHTHDGCQVSASFTKQW